MTRISETAHSGRDCGLMSDSDGQDAKAAVAGNAGSKWRNHLGELYWE